MIYAGLLIIIGLLVRKIYINKNKLNHAEEELSRTKESLDYFKSESISRQQIINSKNKDILTLQNQIDEDTELMAKLIESYDTLAKGYTDLEKN